jgi:hypothetical protein
MVRSGPQVKVWKMRELPVQLQKTISKSHRRVEVTMDSATLHTRVKSGSLIHDPLNRPTCWDEASKQEFLMSALEGSVPHTCLFRKLNEDDEDDAKLLDLFPDATDAIADGGNRIDTIIKFIDNDITLRTNDGHQYYASELPRRILKEFRALSWNIIQYENASRAWLSATTSNYNRGMPMSDGELLRLTAQEQWPRTIALKGLFEKHMWICQAFNQRSNGMALLVRLFRLFLSNDEDTPRWTEHKLDRLNVWLRTPDVVINDKKFSDFDELLGEMKEALCVTSERQQEFIPFMLKCESKFDWTCVINAVAATALSTAYDNISFEIQNVVFAAEMMKYNAHATKLNNAAARKHDTTHTTVKVYIFNEKNQVNQARAAIKEMATKGEDADQVLRERMFKAGKQLLEAGFLDSDDLLHELPEFGDAEDDEDMEEGEIPGA